MRRAVSSAAAARLLHKAASIGDITTVLRRLHSAEHADVDVVLTDLGYTLLHTSCAFGYANIVKLLLERGARVDAATHDQETPLHLAC